MPTAPNERIFREYDIRGLVDRELDPAMYEKFGRAFGTIVRKKTGIARPSVAVGRDNRATSGQYQDAYVKGLLSTGCDVIDIGELTTPAVYFASFHLGTDACSAITASHNPPEYNGAKFRIGELAVRGLDLKPVFLKGEFAEGDGRLSHEDVSGAYVKAASEGFKLARTLKVVVDCGNGVAGKLSVASLEACGCEVVPLYCEPDSTYPHHHPNPIKPENYPDLVAAVGREKADLGIMFDGDGDRAGACDESGRILWPDTLLMLFARKQLSTRARPNIVVEIKCSLSLMDDVASHGGRVVLCKTGYPNVEQSMRENDAAVGGEMSGHFYSFGKRKWFSDAIYAACELVHIISTAGLPLSQLVADAPKYHSSQEYRLHVGGDEGEKIRIVNELTKKFKEKHEVIDIDGARVVFPGGWGLARYSNNEPELSLRFESKTEAGLEEIKRIFQEALKPYPVDAKF